MLDLQRWSRELASHSTKSNACDLGSRVVHDGERRPQSSDRYLPRFVQADLGSIKQLKIQMSLPTGSPIPTWSIVDPFSGSSRTKLTATSSATTAPAAGETTFTIDGETTFTIELSEDVIDEFQIQAELPLARPTVKEGASLATIGIPLPRMRQAVSQEAVLVVPQRYRLPTLPSMEILPPGLCCDGGKLVESSLNPEVVAVRYDTSAFPRLNCKRKPRRAMAGGSVINYTNIGSIALAAHCIGRPGKSPARLRRRLCYRFRPHGNVSR